MANHKANEPRRLMKCPLSFHRKVMEKAKELGIEATKMMENSEVIYNGH